MTKQAEKEKPKSGPGSQSISSKEGIRMNSTIKQNKWWIYLIFFLNKLNDGDRLSIKIKWSNVKKVAGIAILSLFLLAGNASADPPPSILEINENEQTSGIGSNCWDVENETYSICADTIGIITPEEPLVTLSLFTAHLTLPFRNPRKS